MPADVEERADGAIGLADHDHRIFSHVGRDEIAGLGNLRLVTEEQPAAREDALELELVDRRVGVDARVDRPVDGIDETGKLFWVVQRCVLNAGSGERLVCR